MTPEAARLLVEKLQADHRGGNGHFEGQGDWCYVCDASCPCPVAQLLDLLPAAGEALVLGPEGWEKRQIVKETHPGVSAECMPGELLLTLRRLRPLASEEMNP